jgi:hypothetical protein
VLQTLTTFTLITEDIFSAKPQVKKFILLYFTNRITRGGGWGGTFLETEEYTKNATNLRP